MLQKVSGRVQNGPRSPPDHLKNDLSFLKILYLLTYVVIVLPIVLPIELPIEFRVFACFYIVFAAFLLVHA